MIYLLTFLAGTLTILNPCVLPILPIILSAAIKSHKWGLIAFAGGMSSTFAAVGIFLVTLGMSFDISPQDMRNFGAVVLIMIGTTMLIKPISEQFSTLTSRYVQNLVPNQTISNQFIIGGLMGIVWAPCTGPTIGAAFTLAIQGHSLFDAATRMFVFALGVCVPILLLGTVLKPHLRKLHKSSAILKYGFALVIIISGISILLSWDKYIEAILLNTLPSWWIDLSTRL